MKKKYIPKSEKRKIKKKAKVFSTEFQKVLYEK